MTEKTFTLLTQRRTAAHKKAADNLSRAESDPAYAAADIEVRRLTIALARATAAGEPAKPLKAQLKASETARIAALKHIGFSPADLKPQYSCAACGDTGFAGDALCMCAKQLNNALLAQASGMSALPRAFFRDFDPALYAEGKQREEIKKLYAKMQDYCDKFPNTKYRNILLIGNSGLGKTQLICSIGNHLLSRGENVLYLTAFGLNNIMLKAHTTFDASREHALDEILNASLLIIDDLGTEPIYRNVTEDYLLSILNERTLNGLHTLISTNLALEPLNARYGTRLVSRLTDKSNTVTHHLTGEDVRLKKIPARW